MSIPTVSSNSPLLPEIYFGKNLEQFENNPPSAKVAVVATSAIGAVTAARSTRAPLQKRVHHMIEEDSSPVRSKYINTSKSVKSPAIISIPGSEEKIVIIDGKEYRAKILGRGHAHRVLSFVGEGFMSINGHQLKLSDIVLRYIEPKNGRKDAVQLRDDIRLQNFLKQHGIPTPTIYVAPDSYNNVSENGTFWLVEKMTAPVNHLDTDVQLFVKKMLEKSIELLTPIINYPRNIMRDSKGELKVIDPASPDEDDFDFYLYQYLLAWADGSKPGAQERFDALVIDFPTEFKEKMHTRLKLLMDGKDDFPVSSHTYAQ